MMKTSFDTFGGFTGRVMPDIEEIVSILSSAGLDGIEINAEIGQFGAKNRHAGLDIPDKEIKRTKEICDRYNLKISSICAHFSFIASQEEERKRAIREYKKCIDQAVMLGTKVVHGYSGSPEKRINDREEEELWLVFKKGCLEVLNYAKDKGVEFGMEAVITHLVHGYESVKRMIEVINRDDLYLNFDPCHLYMSKPKNGHLKVIDEFGARIKHVHIHDAVGRAKFSWEKFKEKREATWENMRPFGLGEIDWLDVIGRLKNQGFDGFLSFDYGPSEGYLPGYKYYIESVAKAYNRFIKEIINQVQGPR